MYVGSAPFHRSLLLSVPAQRINVRIWERERDGDQGHGASSEKGPFFVPLLSSSSDGERRRGEEGMFEETVFAGGNGGGGGVHASRRGRGGKKKRAAKLCKNCFVPQGKRKEGRKKFGSISTPTPTASSSFSLSLSLFYSHATIKECGKQWRNVLSLACSISVGALSSPPRNPAFQI